METERWKQKSSNDMFRRFLMVIKYNEETNFINAIADAQLSPVSKRVYLQRLKTLVQENKKDIYYIVTHPDEFTKWIADNYESDQTRKSYYSAILALFRHNEGLKEQEKENYSKWYTAFNAVHNKIEERYKRNEPTKRQQDAYVPFADVIKARDSLEKGTNERLLFSMYTYLPPLRADFNDVIIYKSRVPEKPQQNYIVLKQNSGTLVLKEFKTTGKLHAIEKDLPKELIDEIQESLKVAPREWLFVDRDNKPFSAKSFTQWANRILARVLGKRTTISMLRHSFISSLDFNKLSVVEKERIAKDMAHTVGMQDKYRFIFDTPSGSQTTCELKCEAKKE